MTARTTALEKLELVLIKVIETAWTETESNIRRGYYRTVEQSIAVANTALADLFRVVTLPRQTRDLK